MYNDCVMILLCVFAVYGAYALLREIATIAFRKSRAVAAVRITKEMDVDACCDAVRLAEEIAATYLQFERGTALLFEEKPTGELWTKEYPIYIKLTDTEDT